MQRLEVSGAVRLLQWSLGVKGLRKNHSFQCKRLILLPDISCRQC